MAVTERDVRQVAELARIGVDDARVPALVAELNGILAHMDVLARVDTSGAGGSATSDAAMRLRDDALGSVPLARSPADFAPASRDGFFLVPRLATHEDGADGGP